MGYEKELVAELVNEIKAAGFRVFVAESGTYGFYTDAEGTRVVSFGVDLGSTKFSGNYSTDCPSQCGTGWGLGSGRHDFREMFESYAPRWAVGDAKVSYTTLAQHLKTYQASSKYTEV